MFGLRRLEIVAYWLLRVGCCVLFVDCCALRAIRCSLFGGCWLLFVVR